MIIQEYFVNFVNSLCKPCLVTAVLDLLQFFLKQITNNLYQMLTIYMSLRTWTCPFPVRRAVGKCKTIQCFAICAMITIALKSVMKMLINFSGRSIS